MSAQRVYLKSTEFQPQQDLILIKVVELHQEENSASGLILSIKKESVTHRPTSGEVISKGSKVENVEIGDFVFWPTADGIDFEFDDGNFLLLRDASIIGTKKKE